MQLRDEHGPVNRPAARLARDGVLALLALALAAPVAAQVASVPTSSLTLNLPPVFAVSGFDVTGDNPLSGAKTSAILAPFLRAQATADTLKKVAAALQGALREQGEGLHYVALAAQVLGVSGRLDVMKFVIAKPSVAGQKGQSESALRASLPELQAAAAPNVPALAVPTVGASEKPSTPVALVSQASQPAPAIDAAVHAVASRPQGVPHVEPVFAINGFDVTGDNPLSSAQTSKVLAPFLRAQATLSTLQKATAALEAALLEQGYGLHRVALPAQELGVAVRLDVVKFAIDKLRVQGPKEHTEANIRASLPELRSGETPNFQRLAVQTAIANENPSKQLRVVLQASEQADQIDAEIQVVDSRPWDVTMGLSNAGSKATGKERLLVSAGYHNLFDLDQQLVGAYTTSPTQAGAVRQLGLNYRIPLYASAGVLSLSLTHSDVVGNFGAFSSSGAGQSLGLSYRQYLAPQAGQRSYLALAVDDLRFDVAKIDGVPLAGQSQRRSRPLSVSYSAAVESDAAVWGYEAQALVNLGTGRGNSLADYQSEDVRISTHRWAALRGSAHFSAPLAPGWLGAARTQFQYSPYALISGDQLGLGGASSVRGTEERPLSGDKGLSLALELSTPELAAGLRLLAFVDAGWLANVQVNGTTKPATDHLASAGFGLRYAVGNVAAAADWARVGLGSVVPLSVNAASPQAGDQKLHVNITGRF